MEMQKFFYLGNLFTIVLDDFKGIEMVQHLNEVNPITH